MKLSSAFCFFPITVSCKKKNNAPIWYIESTKLKGCIAYGYTIHEAFYNFAKNEQEWIRMAEKYGILQ